MPHIKNIEIIKSLRKYLKDHSPDRNRLLEINATRGLPNAEDLYRFVKLKRMPDWTSSNGYYELNGDIVGLKIVGLSLRQLPLELSKLKHLRYLHLGLNELSDLSLISDLVELEVLHISGNKIEDITFLKKMRSLREIYFWENKVSNISVLRSMKYLSGVYMSRNNVKDISILSSCPSLSELFIENNPIEDISSISQLQNLTMLYAAQLKIKSLPAIHWPKMEDLNLSYNNLTSIDELKDLINLKFLDLSINFISDISIIERFSGLLHLDLSHNRIGNLPSWLLQNEMDLINESDYDEYGLNVKNNPIVNVPTELLRLGKVAIKDYLKSIEYGAQPINEVKVILLGEGAAGKTSVLNYLVGKDYNKHEAQTHGINLDTCTLSNNVKIKLWDFGGQDIMHHTHQFFLTNKSIYVLILNARENTDTEKWLKLIQVFGAESPVIIVTNKIDENPSEHENIKFLDTKYPNLKGRYCRISCATGFNLEDLRNLLTTTIDEIIHIKTLWSQSWLNVKYELENMRNGNLLNDYIHYEKYQEICQKHNVAPTHYETLINWLHQLGVITYFADSGLSETNVINPSWLTVAFYSIINSQRVASEFGRFNLSDLELILDKEKYPSRKHLFLLSLMLKFELCYKIDDGTFLIPDLLSKEQPNFDFDIHNSLKIKFKYSSFLPKSIFPKLMVRRHEEILNSMKWRTGMVIYDKYYESSALVRVDEEEKEISIFVTGQEKRGYLAGILSNIDSINALYNGLEYDKLIPCICERCKSIPIPFYYKYDVLRIARGNNRKTYICQNSDSDVLINDLLGVLITREEMEFEINKFIGKGASKIKKSLEDGNVHDFLNTIRSLFSSVSYLIFEKSEKSYHMPLFLLLRSIFASDVRGDEIQSKGRADIIIDIESYLYVLELKLDASVNEALAQIKRNKYYEPYLLEPRKTILVGINFSSKERNISEFIVEELNSSGL